LVSSVALAAAGAAAAAQAPRPRATTAAPGKLAEEAGERVTLAELLAAAVRRSPQLAIASSDHDEARERNDAADAIDEWHLIARLNGEETTVDRALAGPSLAIDTRTASGAVGVERSLSTGGDVTVTVSTGESHYVYPGIAARGQIAQDVLTGGTTASARLQASQPLLRGAGEDVARADQKSTRLAARAQSAQAEDEAAQLVRDLVVGYWELAYAAETLAVDREGEALALHQIPITQEVVGLGFAPPSAMKIAELQVALRQDTVLRDAMALGDQSLAVRRLVGLELTSTPLAPGDDVEIPSTAWSERDAVAATLAHGPSIAQKRFAQREAEVTVDVASNAALPRLDLQVSGEVDGVASGVSDAFRQLGSAQAYSITGGLALRWDIGGAAGAAAAAARVHRARLDAERMDLDHQLTASAMSAVRQLQLARQRIELGELAVRVADEALHSETAAFKAGRSTVVLVFQRQDDVSQAKLRLARARIDAVEANVLLEYLTGGLLARYGVKVASLRRVS